MLGCHKIKLEQKHILHITNELKTWPTVIYFARAEQLLAAVKLSQNPEIPEIYERLNQLNLILTHSSI